MSSIRSLSYVLKFKLIYVRLFAVRHFDLQIDDDEHIRLNKSEVNINTLKETAKTQDILPCVIEPSFGIGRIMYALLEHSFRKRDGDDGNSYFALPPLVAPHKCAVLPLVSKPELKSFVDIICKITINFSIEFRLKD